MNEPVITIVGNLSADPVLRTSQAGNQWVSFRVVSTPRVKDRQSGQWTDGEPMWVGCRAFGEHAENIANSLTKGTRVIVTGRLSVSRYMSDQGQERTGLDLEVDEVGPALRWATAQVARNQSRGQVGGFGGDQSGQGGYGAQGGQANQQSQPGWGQPAGGGQQNSPWADPAPQPAGNDTPWGSSSGDDSSFGSDRPF